MAEVPGGPGSNATQEGPTYEELLERLKGLKRARAGAEELAEAAAALKAAKKRHYQARDDAREKRAQGTPSQAAVEAAGRARATYPQPTSLALDEDGFAAAFPWGEEEGQEAAALEFFHREGYVVFRGVLRPEECTATIEEIWGALEEDTPGLARGDSTTYHLLSADTYGLASSPAVFTPQVVRNRQNPRVVSALAVALGLGAGGGEGLLTSHDRWCMYRPTVGVVAEVGGAPRSCPEWRTRGNLHLDLHPWNFLADRTEIDDLSFHRLIDFSKETNMVTQAGGPHVQGVIALTDNRPEDGGTLLVPRFHAAFETWQCALGDVALHQDVGGDLNWVVGRAGGGGSYKFADSDPIHGICRRIPVRAGDFVVWDQRVVHGAQPNMSGRPRLAQFVKGFRRAGAGAGRVAARAALVHKELCRSGTLGLVGEDAHFTEVTPLGARVFGLDTLEARGGAS